MQLISKSNYDTWEHLCTSMMTSAVVRNEVNCQAWSIAIPQSPNPTAQRGRGKEGRAHRAQIHRSTHAHKSKRIATRITRHPPPAAKTSERIQSRDENFIKQGGDHLSSLGFHKYDRNVASNAISMPAWLSKLRLRCEMHSARSDSHLCNNPVLRVWVPIEKLWHWENQLFVGAICYMQ